MNDGFIRSLRREGRPWRSGVKAPARVARDQERGSKEMGTTGIELVTFALPSPATNPSFPVFPLFCFRIAALYHHLATVANMLARPFRPHLSG
jgi:hypothetical protein